MKDICITIRTGAVCLNGIAEKWENCRNCPEDLKDVCVKPYIIPDPDVLPIIPVIPVVTPEVEVWHVENDNCNSCPCEYVDFSTDLTKWDVVRAKLWDKNLSAFYGYSNSLAIENFLDID